MENGVAVAEKKAKGRDVGGVAAHVDDAVFHTVQVGKGALKLTVGRTFAADQAAGAGRGAVNGSSFADGRGDLWVSVDIQIVVRGKIEIFFAGNERGGFGRALMTKKQRIFHPHLGSHFHKPIKGELGTRAVKSGSAAFGGGGSLHRLLASLIGMVVLHASSS